MRVRSCAYGRFLALPASIGLIGKGRCGSVLHVHRVSRERAVLAHSCRTGASGDSRKVADRTHSPSRPPTRTMCAVRPFPTDGFNWRTCRKASSAPTTAP